MCDHNYWTLRQFKEELHKRNVKATGKMECLTSRLIYADSVETQNCILQWCEMLVSQ